MAAASLSEREVWEEDVGVPAYAIHAIHASAEADVLAGPGLVAVDEDVPVP